MKGIAMSVTNFTNYERRLHDEYDQASDADKDRIDRAYRAALEVLEENGKLCKGDGAEVFVAAIWRYYKGLD
jgi:hypothetical protein